MYDIMGKKKIWFSISGVLIFASLSVLVIWGFNYGVDFTGGSMMELKFIGNRPDNQTITKVFQDAKIDQVYVQPVDQDAVLIRTITLTEEQHQQLLMALEKINNPAYTDQVQIKPEDLGISGEGLENATITATGVSNDEAAKILGDKAIKPAFKTISEQRFESIGPAIGQEFKQKSIYSIIVVLMAIIAYIAFAFRKVSYPVESWKYGVSAIIALFHDIIIVPGVFVVLGKFYNVQIDTYFITAILTVLGFSVHDTIVTFDRIRENLRRRQDLTFEKAINLSINETLVRSLNTTLTAVFVLLAIFLFGGATIHYFVLALLLGAIVGTYSSIFIASPLLIWIYKLKKAK